MPITHLSLIKLKLIEIKNNSYLITGFEYQLLPSVIIE